jgi:hypothetical protein
LRSKAHRGANEGDSVSKTLVGEGKEKRQETERSGRPASLSARYQATTGCQGRTTPLSDKKIFPWAAFSISHWDYSIRRSSYIPEATKLEDLFIDLLIPNKMWFRPFHNAKGPVDAINQDQAFF